VHETLPPRPVSSPSPSRLPFAERVARVVARIPHGRVLSYGDIAELLGSGGPRAVGTVLAREGAGLPWHRVVRADGTPPACHDGAAAALLRAEGCPFRRGGDRIDMARARWVPDLSEASGCLDA
jgi:alkylated DNA nucleotide flippase Atl1